MRIAGWVIWCVFARRRPRNHALEGGCSSTASSISSRRLHCRNLGVAAAGAAVKQWQSALCLLIHGLTNKGAAPRGGSLVSQFLGREARRAQGGVLDGHGIRGTVSLGLDDSNPCPSWLTRDHDGRQGVVPILRPRPSAPSRRLKAILRTQPGLRGIGPALGPPRGANAQIAVCSTSTRRRQAGVTWPSRRRWRWRQTWPSAAALGGWLCKVGGGRPAAVVEAPPVAGLKGCEPKAPRA
jgi:hypothetical protein